MDHGLGLEKRRHIDRKSDEKSEEAGCELCCLVRTSCILEVACVEGVEGVVATKEEDREENSGDEYEEEGNYVEPEDWRFSLLSSCEEEDEHQQ